MKSLAILALVCLLTTDGLVGRGEFLPPPIAIAGWTLLAAQLTHDLLNDADLRLDRALQAERSANFERKKAKCGGTLVHYQWESGTCDRVQP